MSNDENKFLPIFQILHINNVWFLLELALALVTSIVRKFVPVCFGSTAFLSSSKFFCFCWLDSLFFSFLCLPILYLNVFLQAPFFCVRAHYGRNCRILSKIQYSSPLQLRYPLLRYFCSYLHYFELGSKKSEPSNLSQLGNSKKIKVTFFIHFNAILVTNINDDWSQLSFEVY